ncbi:MAG: carbohydrate-binding family 9-like protein [Acidobacteria bacterium]|nr:carbohydrate-binding family 9-like protein [Acidobacteriota bacterium]
MRAPRKTAAIALIVSLAVLAEPRSEARGQQVPPSLEPRHYVAQRTTQALTIDGHLDESDWHVASWTDSFIDIQGAGMPAPRHETRAKMLWDDGYFYVAVQLDEPHLWATLTERDSVIFYDNDFEIFIDPDDDTHEYYELEINALGTEWDLFLPLPYRDGGRAVDAWDIAGLRVGIALDGTLNDPSDTDRGWSLEIAMPWDVLEEVARHPGAPESGEVWRVNFSRVQWQLDASSGSYAKILDANTGTPLPEDNWVWSPQQAINMHRPEHWGFVRFDDAPAGTPAEQFEIGVDEPIRMALRELYYRQRAFLEQHGRWADSLSELGEIPGDAGSTRFAPRLEVTSSGWLLSASGPSGATIYLRHDSKTWTEQ